MNYHFDYMIQYFHAHSFIPCLLLDDWDHSHNLVLLRYTFEYFAEMNLIFPTVYSIQFSNYENNGFYDIYNQKLTFAVPWTKS